MPVCISSSYSTEVRIENLLYFVMSAWVCVWTSRFHFVHFNFSGCKMFETHTHTATRSHEHKHSPYAHAHCAMIMPHGYSFPYYNSPYGQCVMLLCIWMTIPSGETNRNVDDDVDSRKVLCSVQRNERDKNPEKMFGDDVATTPK